MVHLHAVEVKDAALKRSSRLVGVDHQVVIELLSGSRRHVEFTAQRPRSLDAYETHGIFEQTVELLSCQRREVGVGRGSDQRLGNACGDAAKERVGAGQGVEDCPADVLTHGRPRCEKTGSDAAPHGGLIVVSSLGEQIQESVDRGGPAFARPGDDPGPLLRVTVHPLAVPGPRPLDRPVGGLVRVTATAGVRDVVVARKGRIRNREAVVSSRVPLHERGQRHMTSGALCTCRVRHVMGVFDRVDLLLVTAEAQLVAWSANLRRVRLVAVDAAYAHAVHAAREERRVLVVFLVDLPIGVVDLGLVRKHRPEMVDESGTCHDSAGEFRAARMAGATRVHDRVQSSTMLFFRSLLITLQGVEEGFRRPADRDVA